MTMRFLPSLGMSGIWTLSSPFDSLVLSTKVYECTSIQKLAAAVADQTDPLNEVYLGNGSTQANFETDLANDDYLITITSEFGEVVVFPRSALAGLPSAEGVVYENTFMGVSLSSLRQDFDLSILEEKIKALVMDTVGVNCTVYYAKVGESIILKPEQSEALEQARLMNISTTAESPQRTIRDLESQVAQMSEKLATLSAYIAAHHT